MSHHHHHHLDTDGAGAPRSRLIIALAITAVLNSAANRRFSFGVRGRDNALRHQLFGLGVFLFGWLVTAGSLLFLHTVAPDATKHIELIILVVANLVATLTRFVGLRWVFRKTPEVVA